MRDHLPEALLKLHDVRAITGLSSTTIYARMNAGRFPPARQVGGRAVAWLQSEVLGWIAALPVTTRDTRRDNTPEHIGQTEQKQRAA